VLRNELPLLGEEDGASRGKVRVHRSFDGLFGKRV
jgi:hypothetical protein